MNYLFSSESVTKGHPDKVCDRISDAVLDAVLKEDPNARVACEAAVKTGFALIFGEITTNAKIDYEKVVRKAIIEAGYDRDELEYNGNNIDVIIKLSEQSNDIAMGVNQEKTLNQGAGDQGIMFGYASNETKSYMPLAIDLAHKLAYRLTYVRENNIILGLRPDGKTQVTVEYDKNNNPVRIDTILISTQHDEDISSEYLEEKLTKEVVNNVITNGLIDKKTKLIFNPTGKFVLGGPAADSGLTGRKLIVDTYGGYARHGGGAFSGKDASKVDRSAAYMARYLAKNIVAAKIADKVEIQLAYAIGIAKPISININTFQTGKVSDEKIYETIINNFDLRPAAIIEKLKLKQSIYTKTSSYGHFGRNDENFTWEGLEDIAIFKSLL
ncbi:MAG TPA: methionine adenosyltransferase [Acholeplasmataceae bacterium]|nr:methionine adenosyltransferase [Acholeplasmataceae bacterium]